jgi:hypothetical protein
MTTPMEIDYKRELHHLCTSDAQSRTREALW